MFQFALDGALFTLKARSPALAPLFTLPPEIRAHRPYSPLYQILVYCPLVKLLSWIPMQGRGFSPAPLS